MASLRRRCRIVIALFGLAAILTTALSVTARTGGGSTILNTLPLTVHGFAGVELPVEQSTIGILETKNVLVRDYVSPEGVHVFLSIVYYPHYRVSFHLPEGCMQGRGSVIITKGNETFDIPKRKTPVSMNSFILEQADGYEHVLYYFVTGDLITASYPEMRFHLMTEHLKRKNTGAALVRFSTRVGNRETSKRSETFKEFVAHMTALLPAYLG